MATKKQVNYVLFMAVKLYEEEIYKREELEKMSHQEISKEINKLQPAWSGKMLLDEVGREME